MRSLASLKSINLCLGRAHRFGLTTVVILRPSYCEVFFTCAVSRLLACL